MEQETLLRSATAWQRKHKSAKRLGEEIERYLAEQTGDLVRGDLAAQAFMELLPVGLRNFCSVERYAQGVLYITAAPGVYMHELYAARAELLEQLRQRRPSVNVKEIRIGPGRKF